MARYLLVQVDDNDRADALMRKLEPVAGMRVIGLFGRPTKFCEGCPRDPNESSTRGPKFGWWHCKTCGKVRPGMSHMLKNLLDPEDLPIRYLDLFLQTKEPYAPPLEKYGQASFDQLNKGLVEVRKKLARANDPKVQARRLASRERRRAKKERMRNS